MTNILHVERFKDVLRKSTLDMALEGTQLHFKNGMIYSQMISEPSDIITIIEIANDVIDLSKEDDITLRFREASVKVFPALDILETADVDVKIYDESTAARIILKPKYTYKGVEQTGTSTIQMVAESVLRDMVLSRAKREGIEYFSVMPVDDELMKLFSWVKRIGILHPNVYIEVKDGNISIESSDKNNTYGNGFHFPIMSGIEIHDLTIAFTYANFVHLYNVIVDELSKGEDAKELKFGCAFFDQDQGSGMIHVTAADQSEQYFLLSTSI